MATGWTRAWAGLLGGAALWFAAAEASAVEPGPLRRALEEPAPAAAAVPEGKLAFEAEVGLLRSTINGVAFRHVARYDEFFHDGSGISLAGRLHLVKSKEGIPSSSWGLLLKLESVLFPGKTNRTATGDVWDPEDFRMNKAYLGLHMRWLLGKGFFLTPEAAIGYAWLDGVDATLYASDGTSTRGPLYSSTVTLGIEAAAALGWESKQGIGVRLFGGWWASAGPEAAPPAFRGASSDPRPLDGWFVGFAFSYRFKTKPADAADEEDVKPSRRRAHEG
ncbi:MAG: hypothetical protein L0216_18060 [Planctomycetales bacterium]|nr:hypothetical protein [Planctomycetales bacterium]